MLFAKRHFQACLDEGKIAAAIRGAEEGTTGEIRIAVAPAFFGRIETRARRAFVRLGMVKTQRRNGVLIFVVPSRRQFRVLGDQGIHELVGQAFWDQVAEGIGTRFARQEFTEGLVEAVEAVGTELARHFPAEGPNPNELPDGIAKG